MILWDSFLKAETNNRVLLERETQLKLPATFVEQTSSSRTMTFYEY